MRSLLAAFVLTLATVPSSDGQGPTDQSGDSQKSRLSINRPSRGGVFRVVRVAKNDVLVVRQAPGSQSGAVGQIPAGSSGLIQIAAGVRVGEDTWIRISWNGAVRGWVNQYYLERGSSAKPVAKLRAPEKPPEKPAEAPAEKPPGKPVPAPESSTPSPPDAAPSNAAASEKVASPPDAMPLQGPAPVPEPVPVPETMPVPDAAPVVKAPPAPVPEAMPKPVEAPVVKALPVPVPETMPVPDAAPVVKAPPAPVPEAMLKPVEAPVVKTPPAPVPETMPVPDAAPVAETPPPPVVATAQTPLPSQEVISPPVDPVPKVAAIPSPVPPPSVAPPPAGDAKGPSMKEFTAECDRTSAALFQKGVALLKTARYREASGLPAFTTESSRAMHVILNEYSSLWEHLAENFHSFVPANEAGFWGEYAAVSGLALREAGLTAGYLGIVAPSAQHTKIYFDVLKIHAAWLRLSEEIVSPKVEGAGVLPSRPMPPLPLEVAGFGDLLIGLSALDERAAADFEERDSEAHSVSELVQFSRPADRAFYESRLRINQAGEEEDGPGLMSFLRLSHALDHGVHFARHGSAIGGAPELARHRLDIERIKLEHEETFQRLLEKLLEQ